MSARERLIVALDAQELREALTLARRLRGVVQTVKVGSILFTACGPEAIRRLQALGFDIMLDLKFHDIPSTVERSCRAAAGHRVRLLTVHATGEPAMLEAALRGVRAGAKHRHVRVPLVLGVTVLTSMESASSVRSRVLGLAQRAVQAGCDGVVASAHETAALSRRFGRRLRIACPGIRPHDRQDDQRRVATPEAAIAAGAHWLIVGRPITEARDPRSAAQEMIAAMEVAQGC